MACDHLGRVEELSDYVFFDIFKYLELADCVRFERVHSDWKRLLRESVKKIDLNWNYAHNVIGRPDGFTIALRFPNLREFTFSYHYDSPDDYQDFAAKLAVACPRLEFINNPFIFAKYANALTNNNLKRLDLTDFEWMARCTEAGIKTMCEAVSHCPKLTQLSFYSNSYSEQCSQEMLPFVKVFGPRVKTLITNKPQYFMSSHGENFLTNLETLDATMMKKEDAQNILKLTTLKNLTMTSPNEAAVEELRNFTGLKKLDVYLTNIRGFEDKLYTLIANNRSTLTTLKISYSGVCQEIVNSIVYNCPKLRVLKFRQEIDNLPASTFKEIDQMIVLHKRLRQISILWTRFDCVYQAMDILEAMTKLRLARFIVNPDKFDIDLVQNLSVDYASRHPKRKIHLTWFFDCSRYNGCFKPLQMTSGNLRFEAERLAAFMASGNL